MFSLALNLISLFLAGDTVTSPQEADLLFIGDAMQHQAQLDRAKELGQGEYDYTDCFSLINETIKDADYAVCNLEVPLGGPPSYSGYPCFSAPDSYAQALADAGFDLMLTANNHCLDRGDKAMRRTLDILDEIGVDHTGTFHDFADRDSLAPLIKEINGFKIAFLNYTYGTNGIVPKDGAEISYIDKDKIRKEIELSRTKGAELVVVAMHWGIEYVLIENKVQRDLADFLIDCGADMIIGSHPHVIQPMEVVKNFREDKDVLVVYSLGNFISNMKTADTRGGAMVWAKIVRDETGKARFKRAEYDIFFSAKPEGNHNFRVIPSWKEKEIPSSQMDHWNIFKRGALKIFNERNINVPRKKPQETSYKTNKFE